MMGITEYPIQKLSSLKLGRASCHPKLQNSIVIKEELRQFVFKLKNERQKKINLGGATGLHFLARPQLVQIRYAKRNSVRFSIGQELVYEPPESREEALQQAITSLRVVLGKNLSNVEPKSLKQKIKQSPKRLIVEIPLLNEDPLSISNLAADLVLGYFSTANEVPSKVAVYFSDKETANVAKLRLGDAAGCLGDFKTVPLDMRAYFLVKPAATDLLSLQRIIVGCGAKPVVALNPYWSQVDEEQTELPAMRFLKVFQSCYCFLPLSIKGLFSTSTGAVFKFVQSGKPEGSPWLILTEKKGKWMCANILKKRPSQKDLEDILYDSVAADSPMTKSFSFVKTLIQKKN